MTNDVLDHALMAGVPAKHIGWVSYAGAKLNRSLKCSIEGREYEETAQNLKGKI